MGRHETVRAMLKALDTVDFIHTRMAYDNPFDLRHNWPSRMLDDLRRALLALDEEPDAGDVYTLTEKGKEALRA